MIRYLIIDDEPIAHEIIEGYCDLLPNMILQKNCYDALEALDYLNGHEVDLMFLDLNMPKLKGFDFLKTLTTPPKVIVTTAYSEHALEGFELNVIDYLLKPFSFERLVKAVNKAISTTSQLKPSVEHKSNTIERIFLRGDKKYTQVDLQDLLYLEAAGNYTKVYSTNDMILTRAKISDVLEMMPTGLFLQVHKSFAVASRHIETIEGNRITIGKHQIPIGKVYRMNVNALLG
ncbi:MAG: LytTR family DNA-binding domain-containing protein [Reichenbachiella sp.]|uniref:LytR/AlgR family response regulator transcription factor n=1 Tax=Reichenbachiella sp. TaxID=2184521 RepID=UPI0032657346